ncbi:MAG: sulfatase [Rhizobiaceae bacterium]|nr:sulfatase [Rhizobiaceae bacterium]MCV0408193.1 sulfatase [Rhizobiaceae bacterium]
MNVLYIDIDSLRPDHLGCYGYHRDTSPNIDRLAKDAALFSGVYVSDVPCHPSRTALWSGRHGYKTGVVAHGGTACEPFIEGSTRAWAGQFQQTGWMGALRKAGLYTATISSFAERHGCWHWYAGFNEVVNPGLRGMERADEVTPLAIDWLKRKGRERPWFLHVNLWDPHTPYRTPDAFGNPFKNDPLPGWITADKIAAQMASYGPHGAAEPNGYGYETLHERFPLGPVPIDGMDKARAWIDGYDMGVRYADHHVGLILEELERLGLADDTAVVIGADHGENLGELNIWADHQTADEFTCRVPLIIRWPGLAPVVDDGLHYHFDWAATLIELLGGEVPANWDGCSFASAMRGGEPSSRPWLVLSQGAWSCQRGVRFRFEGEDYLLLRILHNGYRPFGEHALFNLTADPHQENDIAGAAPAALRFGLALLDDWLGRMARESRYDVDPLMTVMREGGPFHTRGELGGYLKHLRATGRAAHADRLLAEHPREALIPAPYREPGF